MRSHKATLQVALQGVGEGMRTYIYCQPPAGGSRLSSTYKLMRRLRRRNHEWVGTLGRGVGLFTPTISVFPM